MPLKILIVEDNRAHMEALTRILKELDNDLRIYSAYDLKTAFCMGLEQHIDLFLVDIILETDKPGDVSGLNFVQEIREIAKYKFAPVIFITALEDPKLYSYSQLHCFKYIEKPFDAQQVRQTVREAMEFPSRSRDDKYVYFRKDGIVYSKCIKEIVHIVSSKRKIVINCINDVLEVQYKTCEEILKELDTDIFIRCSRYDIINRKYIDHIDYINRFVKMKHIEKPVEIGITMKKAFKKRIEDDRVY